MDFKHRRKTLILGMLIFTLALAVEASACPNYEGNVVGHCEQHHGVTYNVVADTEDPNCWPVSNLEYRFVPTPAQSSFKDLSGKRYFAVTPGSYTVHVGNPGFAVNQSGYQATYKIAAPDCQPPRKGLTWGLLRTNQPTGTVRVGCGNNKCEPRRGDTPCTEKLPILCIRKSGPGFPLPKPATVDASSRYNRWSGGVIGTTQATVPPKTLQEAHALCEQEFGEHWRVAEHHDGWGWAFQAYGGVGDPNSRFWMDINDTNGTCWSRSNSPQPWHEPTKQSPAFERFDP